MTLGGGQAVRFGQRRTVAAIPAVGAILKRARTPYRKNPLTEDEALNLVCDARNDEPTYPVKKLLKKFKNDVGD